MPHCNVVSCPIRPPGGPAIRLHRTAGRAKRGHPSGSRSASDAGRTFPWTRTRHPKDTLVALQALDEAEAALIVGGESPECPVPHYGNNDEPGEGHSERGGLTGGSPRFALPHPPGPLISSHRRGRARSQEVSAMMPGAPTSIDWGGSGDKPLGGGEELSMHSSIRLGIRPRRSRWHLMLSAEPSVHKARSQSCGRASTQYTCAMRPRPH